MSAGCTILPTKIRRPQVSADALERARAARILEGALARPLTCVVAPAGFGKTTAVAQWAAVCDKAIAWCSLDEDDTDPLRFWAMAASALEEADSALDIPFSPQDVNWADAGEVHDALARLLKVLAADGADRALVLEDVHAVHDAPLISDGLAYLLRNLPPTFHVVMTSRVPVRLPLAKLRMAGGLGELSQDDLRLTPDEQRMLFARAGLALGDDDAARLDEATQGWAAGCRLVELCCADGSGAEVASALARAGDDVSAYLFEEVLGSLDAPLLDFMVKTSTVDSFSVDLAAAITGLEPFQVRERVEGLISQGLFVQRIAGTDDGDWYRYHKMLLDALRANLRRLPDADSRACALAARQWYLDRGFDDAAVGLSFWMRDWDALSDIIVSRWKALYMNDEQATVLRWALLLPRDYLRERPFLCAVAAMPAALAGDAVLSNELIHQALLSLKEGEDFLFAFCMVQKAFVASFDRRTDESGSYAEKALRFLPADELYLRGMMTQVLASSRWTEDPVGAVEGFREAVELQQDIGNANLTCSALANAAIFSALIGHLPDAEKQAPPAPWPCTTSASARANPCSPWPTPPWLSWPTSGEIWKGSPASGSAIGRRRRPRRWLRTRPSSTASQRRRPTLLAPQRPGTSSLPPGEPTRNQFAALCPPWPWRATGVTPSAPRFAHGWARKFVRVARVSSIWPAPSAWATTMLGSGERCSSTRSSPTTSRCG